MELWNKVKEVSASGIDKAKDFSVMGVAKAKDLGEQAKLSIQKEKLQFKMKEIYMEVGKGFAENHQDLLKEHYKMQSIALAEIKDELLKIEASLAKYKAEK